MKHADPVCNWILFGFAEGDVMEVYAKIVFQRGGSVQRRINKAEVFRIELAHATRVSHQSLKNGSASCSKPVFFFFPSVLDSIDNM